MQFVLMMPALGFCLKYKTDGNVQKFNKEINVHRRLYLKNWTFL